VGGCFFVFFLGFVFGMSAHAAACLAATLTEAAIRAGVFLEKDYFSHSFILTQIMRLTQKIQLLRRYVKKIFIMSQLRY